MGSGPLACRAKNNHAGATEALRGFESRWKKGMFMHRGALFNLHNKPVCRKVDLFFSLLNRTVKMSVLTVGFLKPEAHFVPSKAEVIHLANSVVAVQFNFRL